LLQTYQLCFFGQHGTKKIDDIPDASLGWILGSRSRWISSIAAFTRHDLERLDPGKMSNRCVGVWNHFWSSKSRLTGKRD
jgi:hypothetical protein